VAEEGMNIFFTIKSTILNYFYFLGKLIIFFLRFCFFFFIEAVPFPRKRTPLEVEASVALGLFLRVEFEGICGGPVILALKELRLG
jgi:hypothetical protein